MIVCSDDRHQSSTQQRHHLCLSQAARKGLVTILHASKEAAHENTHNQELYHSDLYCTGEAKITKPARNVKEYTRADKLRHTQLQRCVERPALLDEVKYLDSDCTPLASSAIPFWDTDEKSCLPYTPPKVLSSCQCKTELAGENREGGKQTSGDFTSDLVAGSQPPNGCISSPLATALHRQGAAAGKLTTRLEHPFEEKCRLLLNDGMSSSCFAQWGIGTTCRKGLKKSQANQDDFFVYCCNEWGMYGVFDGHGPGGHFVSNFIQWHLPNIIHDYIIANMGVPDALKKSFLRVNQMLKVASKRQDFDLVSSGSTASVVLHRKQENKLFVAHVGDSKIILATRNNAGRLVAERITKEHRPNDPLEKHRIELSGGEVRRPVGHVPYRVFVKGSNFPGLAMSRSLGDTLGHAVGIISVPDIMERAIVEGVDEYLIICSDGVWEFITDQEAVDIVSRYPADQADKAVAKLSLDAWNRWVDRNGNSVDDITAQIIHMFPSSSPRSLVKREDYESLDPLVLLRR
ncbi:PP2C family protein [Cyclospora cayetanensis]|uniref:PP2C family protein n=1 Tax=Cyclospora cayetanensis TaxID=88456 RepID=A0A1D3CQV3_9EIME|nr:PP2C family protein [Cyclospora cayetanensis]